ncbi:MAG TPA: EFR1 family ferrodoxin [Syntrophorhabdaceae bacterium]|nr:EFR1 family ferrodoxin [Syntrophorhabdaceae bacterium]
MKAIIIYFSLSGNTKKIAQAIRKGMSPLLESCDLVKLKDVDSKRIENYDLIGIGSPVWGGPPKQLMWFVEALPDLHGKYAFAFSTHGARGGRFFPVLIKLLKKKGLKVIGLRDWYGSVFLPMMPKPYFTEGHPDEIDLAEARAFGEEMAKLRLRVEAEGLRAVPRLPKLPLPRATRLKRPRPKFNAEKCTYPACTLCIDHCPVNGIDLNARPVVFGKNCHTCHFCEMICPQGAISVDYDSFIKKGHRRGKTIYVSSLAQAEAEGTFRPLVPIESIRWDIPYYKIYSEHPRYIIPDED